MYLQRFSSKSCCLCGSSNKLTREHKIKAAALRQHFGVEGLVIGNFDLGSENIKFAQSSKSKHFKFKAFLCEDCNTSRTQPADKEFDHFNGLAQIKVKNGEDPKDLFDLERYSENSAPYLNIFRYFAKILCCHLAELEAPIPVALAKFAISEAPTNCVWLEVKRDPTFDNAITAIGEHQYSAHGGLVVYSDKITGCPNAFHSSITIGALQYVFHMRLLEAEKTEMQDIYPDFYEFCASKAREAMNNPIPEAKQLQLGLIKDGT